jgi:hypothetical protein
LSRGVRTAQGLGGGFDGSRALALFTRRAALVDLMKLEDAPGHYPEDEAAPAQGAVEGFNVLVFGDHDDHSFTHRTTPQKT